MKKCISIIQTQIISRLFHRICTESVTFNVNVTVLPLKKCHTHVLTLFSLLPVAITTKEHN